ncbi:hypothetical protein RJT34_23632 [Clitoria ternatea]|uniref:DUF4220 domain-containing protein n=1 Tax=Clitoria ternatea TaxID=43366 RepID=A0AAN9FLY3_CLITE
MWNEAYKNIAKEWIVWELRILVLFSLSLQTFLIFFGNRRKYVSKTWLQFVVWLTYLSADWVATVALGILYKDSKHLCTQPKAKKDGEEAGLEFRIVAMWAPFLLVHLGGPDTITAYSLEDNELWLRHFLGLFYQLIVAANVVYRSWDCHPDRVFLLIFVTIPVLVAGIIKYGEKTWSLRSASSKQFRESILPPPDPCPNYAKFMDHYNSRKAEGYQVSLGKVIEDPPIVLSHSHSQLGPINDTIIGASSLHDGFYFFKIFECLFADLILSFQDHRNSQTFFQNIPWNYAFEVIEVELGLMYDMLFTKAVLTYSSLGILLKLVSFFSTLSAFITFSFLTTGEKLIDSSDRNITYVLFIGAVLLEIYAFIVLLSSSWTMLWLSKHKSWRLDQLYKVISCFQKWFKLSHTKRWYNHMSQLNLIDFCLKDDKSVKCTKFFPNIMWSDCKREGVPKELKVLIFEQLKDKATEASNIEACKKLCSHRGDQALHRWSCSRHAIDWGIKGVEFDQSILLWHIATDLCYFSDGHHNLNLVALQSYETSKLLSNYMLYLLVRCPFMLPNGIGQIRFEDTCAEASELLQERKYISGRDQVCNMILGVNTDVPPSQVKGDRSKSVLFDACRLAKSLQLLEADEDWPKERKWEMISHVWVEMLCHAACHCRGLHHAKQLSQGGELLTHVWLLMAHLGITEQFQISQGHVRAKLVLT